MEKAPRSRRALPKMVMLASWTASEDTLPAPEIQRRVILRRFRFSPAVAAAIAALAFPEVRP